MAFFLFFGYVRLALDYDEYVSVLSLVGCLAGGHFFACLVVFQVSTTYYVLYLLYYTVQLPFYL